MMKLIKNTPSDGLKIFGFFALFALLVLAALPLQAKPEASPCPPPAELTAVLKQSLFESEDAFNRIMGTNTASFIYKFDVEATHYDLKGYRSLPKGGFTVPARLAWMYKFAQKKPTITGAGTYIDYRILSVTQHHILEFARGGAEGQTLMVIKATPDGREIVTAESQVPERTFKQIATIHDQFNQAANK